MAQRKYEKYFYSRKMTAVLNRIRIKGIRSHLHFLLTRTFFFFKAHAVPNPRRFPATARVPLSRACREYRVNFLIETHTHTYKEIHTCTRRKWQRREIRTKRLFISLVTASQCTTVPFVWRTRRHFVEQSVRHFACQRGQFEIPSMRTMNLWIKFKFPSFRLNSISFPFVLVIFRWLSSRHFVRSKILYTGNINSINLSLVVWRMIVGIQRPIFHPNIYLYIPNINCAGTNFCDCIIYENCYENRIIFYFRNVQFLRVYWKSWYFKLLNNIINKII